MSYVLDFRMRPSGGAVSNGRLYLSDGRTPVQDPRTVLERGDRFTLLFHGFNVNRRDGLRKLTALGGRLEQAGVIGPVVATLWPGDHWAGSASYPFEGRDADETALILTRYLGLHAARAGEVDLVGHSLGCRVVMELAQRLLARNLFVRRVGLLAAALNADSLAKPRYYRSSTEAARQVHVIWSKADKVLRWAYPMGNFWGGLFSGRDPFGKALGFKGPRRAGRRRPVPTTVTNERFAKTNGIGHGHYLLDPDLANGSPADQARHAHQLMITGRVEDLLTR